MILGTGPSKRYGAGPTLMLKVLTKKNKETNKGNTLNATHPCIQLDLTEGKYFHLSEHTDEVFVVS